MRRPTFRIADLLEWIVALAVVLATIRACFAGRSWTLEWEGTKGAWARRPALLVAPILFGLAIVEGLALAVERGRGRGPRPWGVGRWTLSMAAIYAVLGLIYTYAVLSYRTVTWPASFRVIYPIPADHFSAFVEVVFDIHFACTLAAFLITARLAGLPSAPSPDAREWSGRVFAALVLVMPIAWAAIEFFVR